MAQGGAALEVEQGPGLGGRPSRAVERQSLPHQNGHSVSGDLRLAAAPFITAGDGGVSWVLLYRTNGY